MNQTNNHPSTNHEAMVLLLPWYFNNSLAVDEHQLVEQHIQHCLVCRRELVSLQSLSRALDHASELQVAAQSSFASVAGKLPNRSQPPHAVVKLQHSSGWGRRLKRVMQSSALRYALAASLVLAVTPTLINTFNHADNYYTLSSGLQPDVASSDLHVVFAPSVSPAQLEQLLHELNARTIGGANSLGALTLRLNKAEESDVQKVLAQLRQRKDVVLAEPVLQP